MECLHADIFPCVLWTSTFFPQIVTSPHDNFLCRVLWCCWEKHFPLVLTAPLCFNASCLLEWRNFKCCLNVFTAEKTSKDQHQNTTYAGLAIDWSPARPAYVVFWCWSVLVFFSRVLKSSSVIWQMTETIWWTHTTMQYTVDTVPNLDNWLSYCMNYSETCTNSFSL